MLKKGVSIKIACVVKFNVLITCVKPNLMSCLGQATGKCGDVTGGLRTTLFSAQNMYLSRIYRRNCLELDNYGCFCLRCVCGDSRVENAALEG